MSLRGLVMRRAPIPPRRKAGLFTPRGAAINPLSSCRRSIHDDRPAPRRRKKPIGANASVGLQGAALIHELLRLQHSNRMTAIARRFFTAARNAQIRMASGRVKAAITRHADAAGGFQRKTTRACRRAAIDCPGLRQRSVRGRATGHVGRRAGRVASGAASDSHSRSPHGASSANTAGQAGLAAVGRQIVALGRRGPMLAAAALAFLQVDTLQSIPPSTTSRFASASRSSRVAQRFACHGRRRLDGRRLDGCGAARRAVIVPGNLVVQSNVKTIQHPTGGIVAEIAVHDGMRVKTGDLLVRAGCHPGPRQLAHDRQAAR